MKDITTKAFPTKTLLENMISNDLKSSYQGLEVKIEKGKIVSCGKGTYIIESVLFCFYNENVLMAGKNQFYPVASYFIQFTLIDKKQSSKIVRIKDINHLPKL